MTDKLKQIVKEELEKLPKESQEAIGSCEWGKITEEIGKKYLLTESEINNLQVEILLVLTGLSDYELFPVYIETKVGTTTKEAEEIAKEVEREIFIPIMNKMPVSQPKEYAIEQQISERFAKLPKNIQDIIVEVNYWSKLYEVATAHDLTVEKMEILEGITTDVILGKVKPEQYEEVLQKSLGLPVGKNRELVKAINESILMDIRRRVMGTSPRRDEKEEEIFRNAGIEIVNEDAPKTETKKEEPPISIVAPAPSPILAQKLAGQFKIEKTETEHTMPGVSATPKPSGAPSVPKIDPYREEVE